MKEEEEEVLKIAERLQAQAFYNKAKLSLFEALQIATEIQRNQILSKAFVVTDVGPSAFEAIAMQLGMKTKGSDITVIDAIFSISEAIHSINENE